MLRSGGSRETCVRTDRRSPASSAMGGRRSSQKQSAAICCRDAGQSSKTCALSSFSDMHIQLIMACANMCRTSPVKASAKDICSSPAARAAIFFLTCSRSKNRLNGRAIQPNLEQKLKQCDALAQHSRPVDERAAGALFDNRQLQGAGRELDERRDSPHHVRQPLLELSGEHGRDSSAKAAAQLEPCSGAFVVDTVKECRGPRAAKRGVVHRLDEQVRGRQASIRSKSTSFGSAGCKKSSSALMNCGSRENRKKSCTETHVVKPATSPSIAAARAASLRSPSTAAHDCKRLVGRLAGHLNKCSGTTTPISCTTKSCSTNCASSAKPAAREASSGASNKSETNADGSAHTHRTAASAPGSEASSASTAAQKEVSEHLSSIEDTKSAPLSQRESKHRRADSTVWSDARP
eukprot:scaffold320393_cov28-Tisochrysis_lutea.AAC.3